jgi:hypothetical protein
MGTFFEDSYNKWYEKWPIVASTKEEIRKADGSAERALACQYKAVDSVSVY